MISFFEHQEGYTVACCYKYWVSTLSWAVTAFARIYLGQHYFSDCFVAIVYGLPLGMALETVYFKTTFGSYFQNSFGVTPHSELSVLMVFGILLFGLCLALLIDKEP